MSKLMRHFFKNRLNGILLFLFFSQFVYPQLTINVSNIPSNTPSNADIYIASNFNGWNPGDSNYMLTNNGNGTYQITFNPSVGTLEYKFTRGNWSSVEGNAQGNTIPNRTLSFSGSKQTINVSILSWEDQGSGTGTATENVAIIDEKFNMPQLNRTRRIWIYLPPNYNTSTKSFPVLYMQDGQNLFDINTSFSGEWEVDESLNKLFDNGDNGVIVVGIDNGGGKRIDEYSPWINHEYGGGEGDKYIDFIIETLKPFIDSKYRTLTDRLNTGIMGSSLGAFISFYGAIEHQDVFSKVGVFSPSFWFSEEVYTHVETTGKKQDMQFYLLGGKQESASMIRDMEKMVNTLKTVGFTDEEILMVTDDDGAHSEWYWRREFPDAYTWLYNNSSLEVPTYFEGSDFSIFPNPFSESLHISTEKEMENIKIKIFDINGMLVFLKQISKNENFDLGNLKNGVYFLQVFDNGKSILTKKIICIK